MQNSVSGSTASPAFSQAKRDLADKLRENIASITFTKKDGTERVMKCTLKEGVAVPHERKTDRVKEPKDDLLPVWDIEAEAWRTIIIPNIKAIHIVEN